MTFNNVRFHNSSTTGTIGSTAYNRSSVFNVRFYHGCLIPAFEKKKEAVFQNFLSTLMKVKWFGRRRL